ncbi:uncharacterized protein LOC128200295 [Galleria mellonella]|uniref:Uncharacterized protein LOC128200295 n=1 Tax=Galleria mellonella TaxID=7137 RepID=A0ABM3MD36_GALME|nr:uncharacterized protein LOC128200295 [Galleria mellonella]
MHYGASNLQICLHTGMVFWSDRSQSFCTLSDNTSHQPAAIWVHLTPIIDMIKRETSETTIIHFYSDGPSAQYRQKNNFYLLVYYTQKYVLQYTTWSFYEAGYGKNLVDGIGGSIKRTLDRKVCIGNDIVYAKDAYNLLKQCLKATKVFLIDSSEIENVTKILPAKIPVLKGTMNLHQIITDQSDDPLTIKYRDLGYFCSDLRGQCACFSPKLHSVLPSLSNNELSQNYPLTSEKSTASTCPTQEPPLSLNLVEEFNIPEEHFIDDLILTFERDQICPRNDHDAEDPWYKNINALSDTEKGLLNNNNNDKLATLA